MIDDFCLLYGTGKGIEIGDFCHITAYSLLLANGLIKFNDFSAVGPRCTLLAATDNYEGEGFIGLKIFMWVLSIAATMLGSPVNYLNSLMHCRA